LDITKNLPKEYLNVKGIRTTLIGDTKVAREFLHDMTNLFFRMELVNVSRLPQYWLDEQLDNGGEIRVQINHGIKMAYIYIPPTAPAPEKKKLRYEIESFYVKYVPAHHVYDADGNWLGIAVHESGEWSQTPTFISCEEDEIYPFKYGLWSYWYNGVEPEDYTERLLTIKYLGDKTKEYYEVPATNKYYLDDSFEYGDDININTWESETYLDLHCCGICHASGGLQRDMRRGHITQKDYYIYIATDPEGYSGPKVKNCNQTQEFDSYYEANGSGFNLSVIGCDPENPPDPTACERWWDRWENDNPQNPPDYEDEPAAYYDYDHSSNYTLYNKTFGESVDISSVCTTAAGTTTQDAAFFFYLTEHNYVLERTKITTYDYDTCDWNISNDSNTTDKTKEYAVISVLGTEYTLHEIESSNDNLLTYYTHPRIYQIGDNYIVLASYTKRIDENFNYLLFNGDTVQCQDTAEIYARVDYTHKLPITVDDQEVYGNGEFSLIKIITKETIELLNYQE
jgi:hypothetical protein